jgi:hypothetical protein
VETTVYASFLLGVRACHDRRKCFGRLRISKLNKATVALAPITQPPFFAALFPLATVGVALDVAPITDGERSRNVRLLSLKGLALFFDRHTPSFFCRSVLLFLL